METTLFIDDDVLAAARAMAARQERTLGEIISDLSRQTLERRAASAARNGLPVLVVTPGASPVTLETVNALRDLST